MCSTPKLKPVKQTKNYQKTLSMDMDQASYSRMIRLANAAYEKRHPESFDKPVRTRKNKKIRPTFSSKPLSYWLTKANMTELRYLLSNYISIN